MIWMSSIGAESFVQDYQPCTFNPLCSCTKSYDSLGEVHCVDVYFPRIPPAINRSRLSTLHLRNNDLDSIEPYFLVNTGKLFYFLINIIHMVLNSLNFLKSKGETLIRVIITFC